MKTNLGVALVLSSFFWILPVERAIAQTMEDALLKQNDCKQSTLKNFESKLDQNGQLSAEDDKALNEQLAACEPAKSDAPIVAEPKAEPEKTETEEDPYGLLKYVKDNPKLLENVLLLSKDNSDFQNLMILAKDKDGSSKLPNALGLGAIHSSSTGFGLQLNGDFSGNKGGRVFGAARLLSTKSPGYNLPYLRIGGSIDASKEDTWLKELLPNSLPVLTAQFIRDKGLDQKGAGSVSLTKNTRYKSHEIKRFALALDGMYGVEGGIGVTDDSQVIPYLQAITGGDAEVCWRLFKESRHNYLCGQLGGKAHAGLLQAGFGVDAGVSYKYVWDDRTINSLSVGVTGGFNNNVDADGWHGDGLTTFGVKIQ